MHMVVLAHLQRMWSLRGREGFGILSPSRRACSAGFGVFVEMKYLFSIALEASFGEVMGVYLTCQTLRLGASNGGPASHIVLAEPRAF